MFRGAMVAAALLVVAHAAAAGSRFVAESRDLRRPDAPVRTSTLWLEGARIRLEVDATHAVIYHGDEEVGWWIDHGARSVRRVDRATTVSVAQGVGRANAAARRTIESLPPAQRQAAERLLDRTLGTPTRVSPDIEVRARGESERIAGVPCDVHEIRRGGVRRAEVCRASHAAIGATAASRSALRSLSDSLAAVLPSLAPEPLRQDGVDALYAFEQLDGFPLRVRLFEPDGAIWESRVTEFVTREAPATAFDLPDGYESKLPLGPAPPSQPAAPASPPG